MALRFRRSIKLAPGLRLNLSKSGASLSAGPRGASLTFGSRGVYGNAGIPGTGVYTRSRLSSPADAPEVRPGRVAVGATIRVEDDGTVKFLDEQGQPLSDYLTNLAKRQQGSKIRELLIETSERINGEVEALQKVHEYTPGPHEHQKKARHDFSTPQPVAPAPRAVGFFDRLFGRRESIESNNASQQAEYVADLASWKTAKAAFEKAEAEASRLFNERLRADTDFMQQLLEQNLQEINWPRETIVSFEISADARNAAIDVDLPEMEDMPTRIMSVPERGYKLSVKQIKPKQLNEIYSRLVYGIGFRIIGEAFATLPTVEDVTLSAFTQRDSPATGERHDAYIYSVHVDRAAWSRINFKKLAAIDVAEALASFSMRSSISRAGAFEQIIPLNADTQSHANT